MGKFAFGFAETGTVNLLCPRQGLRCCALFADLECKLKEVFFSCPKIKILWLLALPRNEKSTAMPPLWASQNFLTSRAIIHRLIQRTNLTKNDHVIEIGPGKGHITRALLERCCHVTAVELDRALYLRLTEQFKGAANLTLRNADFCSFSLPAKGPYKVFANIPFSRTTDIIRRLTECRTPPTDAYLILEKGAAKRFMGQPRETLRSLSLKPFFKMEILYHFRREDFHPKPSVDIVMLHIAKRAHPDLPGRLSASLSGVSCKSI